MGRREVLEGVKGGRMEVAQGGGEVCNQRCCDHQGKAVDREAK